MIYLGLAYICLHTLFLLTTLCFPHQHLLYGNTGPANQEIESFYAVQVCTPPFLSEKGGGPLYEENR